MLTGSYSHQGFIKLLSKSNLLLKYKIPIQDYKDQKIWKRQTLKFMYPWLKHSSSIHSSHYPQLYNHGVEIIIIWIINSYRIIYKG